MTYKQKALDLFAHLSATNPLFAAMEKTVEGSPWHREANVLVHTQMVLNEYIVRTDAVVDQWTHDDFLGAVSCIFHDVGKPPAQITKHSESRGEYRAYHGHEILSARLFEDWACTNYGQGMAATLSPTDIAAIVFYIEHHMPWSMVNEGKLNQLAQTAKLYNIEVFCRALLADQFGRTSDDWDVNTARSAAWVEKFLERGHAVTLPYFDTSKPVLIMPIGPSGAGKSTLMKSLKLTSDFEVFSLDALRHLWYDAEDYRKAYEMAEADKKFEGRADAYFIAMTKEGKSIFVDNTNIGVNRRRKYLTEAVKRGYSTRAILMPVALKTIQDRQKTRPDKEVPSKAVYQQYMSVHTPLLGEFDVIDVSAGNLIK